MISDSNLTDNDKSWEVETAKMESLVQISRAEFDHLELTQFVVEHFLSES